MREFNVAIAGCGAISAVGSGMAALLAALRANASGLRACEKFNSPRFQSSIVGSAFGRDALPRVRADRQVSPTSQI
jgi:3-oxoacyl-(acyl-carrier-protein) synthase